MATTIPDGVVGAMATDIARIKPDSRAPTLLANATELSHESRRGSDYGTFVTAIIVRLPVDYYELFDGEVERVSGLKTLLARSVTPDDLADVGRRCRELMIAAATATYRTSMLPEGKEPPKDSEAKTKCEYIVASLGDGSVDKRLTKLIDKAWDLSMGLLHNPEPPRIATFAAAQATILVVRTLERIEADLDG